jgi:hypothetical protein
MEGAAHHQCPGADQRGVPAADQNPSFPPARRRSCPGSSASCAAAR